ncbi:MAG: arsenite methyltransferase [Deltaproteobacteria bacterium]|nr:arsenite methyltransferase [Deltaproteobacteria bacterium]
MTSNQPDQVRESVSRAYAEAVSKGSSCCGGQASCGTPSTERAESLGYTPAELAAVPTEATGTTFGCGNPTALTEIAPGDVVLDLGSGAGLDLILAAQRVGASGRVIGVDMTDEMIERARKNVAAAGLTNVEIRKGIIENLPVETGSVDWIISNCVLNLSPEKPRVFAEIARVLKPGGRMLVSDIVASGMPEWARQSISLYVSCVAGAIPEDDYVGGLRAAGLAEVEVRDRLVYDAETILGFASDAGDELMAMLEKLGLPPTRETALGLARQLEGKIASVRVFGRKPLAS